MLFHLTAWRPWRTTAQQVAAPDVRGAISNIEVFHLREGFAEQRHQMALPRKSGDEAVKFQSEIKIEEERSDHIVELQGPQLHVQWQARTWGSCVSGVGG